MAWLRNFWFLITGCIFKNIKIGIGTLVFLDRVAVIVVVSNRSTSVLFFVFFQRHHFEDLTALQASQGFVFLKVVPQQFVGKRARTTFKKYIINIRAIISAIYGVQRRGRIANQMHKMKLVCRSPNLQ